jgi:hypothetical protein
MKMAAEGEYGENYNHHRQPLTAEIALSHMEPK